MIFNSTDILKEWAQCVWYWATTKSILWNNNISIFSLLWVCAFETHYLGGVYATSSEELTHWKRPWCWEGLGAGGEGDDRGWDGWMASPTRCTWVWVNSGSWWWTGRPGMLQFMGSQRVGHDWATELNWMLTFLLPSINSPLFNDSNPISFWGITLHWLLVCVICLWDWLCLLACGWANYNTLISGHGSCSWIVI